MTEPAYQIENISLDQISESPYQVPGRVGDELIASIKRDGLLEPVTVRPVGDAYELVGGHRRYAAVKSLGWPTIPAIVRELSDTEAANFVYLDNEQREDFND